MLYVDVAVRLLPPQHRDVLRPAGVMWAVPVPIPRVTPPHSRLPSKYSNRSCGPCIQEQ